MRVPQIYALYDFWHTSPNFFLIRVGLLLVILSAAYVWCRWGAGQWGFSPLIQMGQTSLLVYWVHIEFVYGRFSILPKRAVDIRTASLGLLAIFLSMVLLSVLRTKLKGRGAEAWTWFSASKPVTEGQLSFQSADDNAAGSHSPPASGRSPNVGELGLRHLRSRTDRT